jgi:hypothetical protein
VGEISGGGRPFIGSIIGKVAFVEGLALLIVVANSCPAAVFFGDLVPVGRAPEFFRALKRATEFSFSGGID